MSVTYMGKYRMRDGFLFRDMWDYVAQRKQKQTAPLTAPAYVTESDEKRIEALSQEIVSNPWDQRGVYNKSILRIEAEMGGARPISYLEFPRLYAVCEFAMKALCGEDSLPAIGLPKLRTLDLTGSQGLFDPAPLAQMGDFDMLMLKGSKNAHSYIGGKRIGWLQLSETDMDSLEPLATVTGLDILELWDTPVSDLTGIGVHTRLRRLNIAHTAVTDLTPLLALPDLTELILSEDMDADVSVLAGMPGLTITYQ